MGEATPYTTEEVASGLPLKSQDRWVATLTVALEMVKSRDAEIEAFKIDSEARSAKIRELEVEVADYREKFGLESEASGRQETEIERLREVVRAADALVAYLRRDDFYVAGYTRAADLSVLLEAFEAARHDSKGLGGAAPTTCTGITARWCPIHGDCRCEGFIGGNPDSDMDDPICPLHAPDSSHGEGVSPKSSDQREAAPDQREVARLAVELEFILRPGITSSLPKVEVAYPVALELRRLVEVAAPTEETP